MCFYDYDRGEINFIGIYSFWRFRVRIGILVYLFILLIKVVYKFRFVSKGWVGRCCKLYGEGYRNWGMWNIGVFVLFSYSNFLYLIRNLLFLIGFIEIFLNVILVKIEDLNFISFLNIYFVFYLWMGFFFNLVKICFSF